MNVRRWPRAAVLAMTALLPGALKRAVLRSIFGFRIGKRVRIGTAYFDCDRLEIGDDVRIGHGVVFVRTASVRIGDHARIGPLNLFRGGDHIDLAAYSELLRLNVVNAIPEPDCDRKPDSTFRLGYGAVITSSHWIDFTDRVTFGRRSILAGRRSSVYTHNRRRSAPVDVGNFCYIGSDVKIAPGVSIADCTIVGMGAVVSSALRTPFTLAVGVPARAARALTARDAGTLFEKTRADLPDEPTPAIPAASDQPSEHAVDHV